MTAYRSLYQKYRPALFAELVGQAVITNTLRLALEHNRIAHAYLFTGSRGTGKTSTARLLAKAVNCAHRTDGEPDNSCDTCVAIQAGTLMDVLEIDAASNRGIDEIRELRDKVSFAPSVAARKVYIIDEVHMLTKEAFNALLKTLEEPPAHAMFILATTEPHKVPQTIISRCQRFDFRPAPKAVLVAHLQHIADAEEVSLEGAAADLIASAARGSFRDALSLLDTLSGAAGETITESHVSATLGLASHQVIEQLERALATRDQQAALVALREAAEQGIDAVVLRDSVLAYLRTLLLLSTGAHRAASTSAVIAAADWNVPDLVRALRCYADVEIAANAAHPELPLELAALSFLLAEEAPPVPAQSTKPPSRSTGKPAAPAAAPAPPPPAAEPAEGATPAPEAPPPSANPTPAAIEKPSSGDTATDLWEELLRRTRSHYSLSVCLQKTRPLALSDGTLSLAVQSDFFLKKLSDAHSLSSVKEILADIAGAPVAVALAVDEAPERDIFEDALTVFEGAKVDG